jgi:hypothetical protein
MDIYFLVDLLLFFWSSLMGRIFLICDKKLTKVYKRDRALISAELFTAILKLQATAF